MTSVVLASETKALAISELIERYATRNEADGKSPSTVKWYTEILTSFSDYAKSQTGRNSLSVFNLELARGYILYLRQKPRFQGHPYTPPQQRPVSAKTVQCHVRALKPFSSWAHREGYTDEDRLKNLKLPKAERKFIEPLTPEEIQAIVYAIDDTSPPGLRNYAIFMMQVDNGMRSAETAAVTLGQLNLEDGYIRVMGKGSKERFVPIGKFVRRILWRYIEQERAKRAVTGCDRLFLSSRGEPITVNTIKLIFSRLAKSSRVKRLHAHLCRHTFAVNYLLNGGDIFTLQEILGHTTLEMVRHYLRFTASQIRVRHHEYSPIDKWYEKKTGADAPGNGGRLPGDTDMLDCGSRTHYVSWPVGQYKSIQG